MEELLNKLNAVPDSYFGFVMGIIAYCKQKPGRTEKVLRFMNSNEGALASDIVEFVMEQPDFHEHGLRYASRDVEPMAIH